MFLRERFGTLVALLGAIAAVAAVASLPNAALARS